MPPPMPLKYRMLLVLGAAALFTLLLTLKSVTDLTRTGPAIQEEILSYFALYSLWAISRLVFWAFLISSVLMGVGAVVYAALQVVRGKAWHWFGALFASAVSFTYLILLQFCDQLLHIPSSIVASFLYRVSRLYPLHDLLTPGLLAGAKVGFWGVCALICALGVVRLLGQRRLGVAVLLSLLMVVVPAFFYWASIGLPTTPLVAGQYAAQARPNIVMIGADTLRADRFGAAGYHRPVTPYLDGLAADGVQFTNCYVPLARTAPSMASMLTGTWPHTHGVRDNYVANDKTLLPVTDLVTELAEAGYRTSVVSDWAGADLGKLGFGFQHKDLPDDQWNLKYLIRQGPKDLRLFLSLFTHNRFGKTMLPEIYYLAGVPLSSHLGQVATRQIHDLAQGDDPFMLMVFTSNTHLPFGSEYPFYQMFSDPAYQGESRYAMSGLSKPSEIIKRQSQDKSKFDVQQISDLYDGGVLNFDHTVKGIVDYLKASGLMDSTIVVIFSDHGVDLFEKYTWGQGNSLLGDDPSARVPLIILSPQIQQAGLRVEATTRTIDLAPTLLEMAGLPVPDSMEGKSLLPLMRGETSSDQRYAFHETGVWLAPIPGMGEHHLKYPDLFTLLEVRDKATGTLSLKPDMNELAITARDRMVRDDRWKLVYLPMKQGAEYWLFDMQDGYNGAEDVSKKFPAETQRLKTILRQWMGNDTLREWRDGHLVRR